MLKLYYIVDANDSDYKWSKQGFCKVVSAPQRGDVFIIKDFEFTVSKVYFEYVKSDDAYMPHLILK